MPHRALDHTADVGFELTAPTLSELYREAATAYADTVTDVATLETAGARRVAVSAPAPDELLVAFLEELLYLHDTTGFLPARTVVEVHRAAPDAGPRALHLAATLHGEPFDPDRHPHRVLVKAITYHGLEVEEEPRGGWRGRVIFDI